MSFLRERKQFSSTSNAIERDALFASFEHPFVSKPVGSTTTACPLFRGVAGVRNWRRNVCFQGEPVTARTTAMLSCPECPLKISNPSKADIRRSSLAM